MKLTLVNLIFVYFVLTKSETSVKNIGFGGKFEKICLKHRCIQKCCNDGEFVHDYVTATEFGKKCEKFHSNHGVFKTLDFSDVPLYYKNMSKTGKSVKDVYTLVPGVLPSNQTFNDLSFDYSTSEHLHFLSEESVLFEVDPNKFVWWFELTNDKFCIDYRLIKNNDSELVIERASFWSIIPSSGEGGRVQEFSFYVAGLLISCFFLTLVLVVYFLLPGSRALSELIQMSYVASTFGAFLFMAIIMADVYPDDTCRGLSYVTYFFFLASFCWMAVMSYDLWCIHSNTNRPTSRRSERNKFKNYSICAWGIPTAMAIFLIVTNHVDLRHIPWFITPNIPKWGCFIAGGERLLYFYIPMMILIASNWTFFLMTSCSLWKQYKVTSTVDSNGGTKKDHRTLKNRFLMYLKLSIIMGISWVLEVASSFNPDLDVWYVTDAYNMLIGFSVFLIFVCNKRTYKRLRKRFEKTETQKVTSSIHSENIT